MKIRAITLFSPLNWPFDLNAIKSASRFLNFARQQIEEAGFEVQTLRLATPPFMDLLGDPDPDTLLDFATTLETHTQSHGIDHVSIGPLIATTPRSLLSPIHNLPGVIAATETIFCSVLVASTETGLNLAAIKATANAIHQIAQKTPQGFGNLRFAMLANVPPRVPFFPGAYHDSSNPTFGLAIEGADLAVTALQEANTLDEARNNLIHLLNSQVSGLQDVVEFLVDEHSIHFSGVDFSLAPFPKTSRSIAAAMEHLGLSAFGGHGTVFATAFLTNCIRQANIPLTGYSGVMLPVLEDNILAQRASEGCYTVNDLLLYSAVCGTGLDTVPIPGDTTPDQIAGLLLDVATLSVSLNKPLTARLFPVPGLKAGDVTSFDFEYFANSAILPLKPQTASTLFSKGHFFNLGQR